MGLIGEAARIFITVGLNSAAASQGLKTLGKDVDGFSTKMGAWSKTVSASFAGPMQAFGNIGDAADGIKSVAGAVSGLAQTVLGGAARNEQYRTSFEVLLGSADLADQKIRDLQQFANTTPFTLPGVTEAAKMLEVMGGGALDTMENLRMVGDAASFAGQDIKDVAVYFGRLYDGMKNGTPLGEVNMRLQEMGLMSGSTRRKVDELSKGVGEGTISMEEAWKSLGGEFKRFAGQTEKQAQTLNGMWSTFTDSIDAGLATIGTRLLPKIKPALKTATELMNGLGDAGLYVLDNIEMLMPVILAVAIPAIYSLAAAVWSLAAGVIAATWPFVAIGASIMGVIGLIKMLNPDMDVMGDLFLGIATVGQAVANVIGAIDAATRWLQGQVEGLLSPLATLRDILFGVPAPAEAAATAVGHVGGAVDMSAGLIMGSAEAIRKASDVAFGPIKTSSETATHAALLAVNTMLSAILQSFKDTRDGVNAAASGLTDSITAPFQLALDIQKAKDDLSEAQAATHNTKLNAGERAAAAQALREKQAALFKLLAEETTYGTTQERIAKINQLLANNAYVQTMKDGTPEQRAAYQAWVAVMQTELNELAGVARVEGMQAGAAGAAGYKSGLPDNGVVRGWGYKTSAAWMDGLIDAIRDKDGELKESIYDERRLFRAGSPPGPASPLHKIDVWGYNTGEAWAGGFAKAIGRAHSSLSGALSGVGSVLQPEAMGSGRGDGGGITLNIGSFYGTDENIRQLSRELGEVVRYSSLRRSSA